MPRTLFLHVGTHRTATTSIQSFLRRNFVPLQKRGIFNPFSAGRHFGLVNKLFSGTLSAAEVAEDLNARADRKSFDLPAIVLSDEDIVMRRDLDPLAELKAHFDVKVIFALRRQDLWLESWHQQNVKWQWDAALAHLTFPEFLGRRAEFHWIDYDATVQRLEAAFGTEALQLMVFEADQMPGGPVATFARMIGLDTLDGLAPAGHSNTSLSPLMSEFMRTLPLHDIPGPKRRLIEEACARIDARLAPKRTRGAARLMDHATRSAVLADYAAGNAALARRRFGREALFLEPLPPADAPLAPQRLPADSYETIARFVAPLIADLAATALAAAPEEGDSEPPRR